jgi:hypothetical protein
VESGGWRVGGGEQRVESGGWRVESGEWRVEHGEWSVESGGCSVESGAWRMEGSLTGWGKSLPNRIGEGKQNGSKTSHTPSMNQAAYRVSVHNLF